MQTNHRAARQAGFARSLGLVVLGSALLGAFAACNGHCGAQPTPMDAAVSARATPPSPSAAPGATSLDAPPPPADAASPPPRARRPPLAPRRGFPLAQTCAHEPCITAGGERGFRYTGAHPDPRCAPAGVCFNPCPQGMEPGGKIHSDQHCERKCRSSADCEEGKCEEGLCNSWVERPCAVVDAVEGCTTATGRAGLRCQPQGPCYPHCKVGLSLYGGDTCVKECQDSADCPGGRCERDNPGEPAFCSPICPSEGCPYPWE